MHIIYKEIDVTLSQLHSFILSFFRFLVHMSCKGIYHVAMCFTSTNGKEKNEKKKKKEKKKHSKGMEEKLHSYFSTTNENDRGTKKNERTTQTYICF